MARRLQPATNVLSAMASRSQWQRVRLVVLAILSLPALLFFIVPILAIFVRITPPQLVAQLSGDTGKAIALSLVTTLITTGIAVVLGTPIAFLLARHRFVLRPILDTVIDLAMVLPPAVAGIALLITFGRRGLFGPILTDAGITLAFTWVAVVLAQLFVAAPYYIRTAAAALTAVQHECEESAMLDGADAFQVFTRITLPLIAPSVIAGAVMTWARALGEFGATIIFAGNFPGRTQTIPLAIYIGLELDLSTALALSAILLVIAFGVLLLVKGLLRQRITPGR